MALRVLLADNSETIKKVIQLTLQDFAVDLRIVASGLDVVDAVEKFKPDIIFVDILLQKKSGYDVARELKQHPSLGSIPVILMWSGFMEFDEGRAAATMADARLEKPFDAKTLRDMVSKFVVKTKNNPLSNFLDFPTLPPAEEQVPKKRSKDPLEDLQKIQQESLKFAQNVKTNTPVAAAPVKVEPIPLPKEDLHELDLELENSEEFEMQSISGAQSSTLPNLNSGSFKLEIPDDISGGDEFAVDMDKIDKIDDMSFLLNPETTKTPTAHAPKAATSTPSADKLKTPAATATPSVPTKTTAPSYTEADIEKIVNQRVQEVIEKVVWQVVPEMASQLVKKELERLLKEKDSP